MSRPLPPAAASDILRATSKDEEYISLVTSALHEFVVATFPNSITSNPITSHLTSTSARFLYLLTPFNRNIPTTPGEEYAAIFPVQDGRNYTRLPTRIALLLRALCLLSTKDDVARVLQRLWRSFSYLPFPTDAAKACVSAIHRLHTALFYFRGVFPSPALRAAGMSYLRVSLREGAGISAGWLRLLGIIAILQVLIDFVSTLRRAISRARQIHGPSSHGCYSASKHFVQTVVRILLFPHQSSVDEGDEDVQGQPKCILCLSGIRNPTLTKCGHVFCWSCICSWCSENEICPLCRQEVTMKKLVCLYNY